MDLKMIPVHLTKEERAALYKVATRDCRRPEQQVRWILRQALGLTTDQPKAQPATTNEDLVLAQ